jgi:hypothetical protein
MQRPSHNLPEIGLLLPEEICMTDLVMAYYPGPSQEVASIRMAFWHLQQEGSINWAVKVIEDTKNLAALTAKWTPDILVTHWHGEYRPSRNHRIPSEIAKRFRNARGAFIESEGPFLVGHISAGESRFGDGYYDEYGLHEVYDMVIERSGNLNRFPINLAVGIHNAANPAAPLPFDADFRVLSEQSKVR